MTSFLGFLPPHSPRGALKKTTSQLSPKPSAKQRQPPNQKQALTNSGFGYLECIYSKLQSLEFFSSIHFWSHFVFAKSATFQGGFQF